MKNHILVIDDDTKIASLLKEFLSREGYLVTIAEKTKLALEILDLFQINLIILDYMLPEEDGPKFLSRIRNTNKTPVIMLTALGEKKHIIEGLEAGADDYLVKPFEPQELLLRIKNLFKRTSHEKIKKKIFFGQKKFDIEHNILSDENNEHIKLSTMELNLLHALINAEEEIVSREKLIENNSTSKLNERTIDVQIKRLREKIEDKPSSPRYLQTIRGKGYKLYISHIIY